ncbi:hypothetical protein GUITHDRAFT_108822 [Guillardia theta CCMP2712]|uniref:Methyltransferase domain-containing protein n=1 Tax=Guillardia theta (strain CCMP2712) TaxID=905079 RepID=L1J9E9_GUITC|nr:hypothetical protein GUITHDRAFT_108822 [Guillardia theta CCMP2712]EKX45178.1 hypothetical protein GUITHDRAFT_108822 [Guillardia theta CCMP2712]|mmetsp:Transcript_46975/g.147196  ORF Transcript_46975/g.147196 Transcript_46975/m.147196 type:complete len:183 (-) Transcript_46975:382-930(-)|eukprot:XP_005832158.1 hypothetical protein GUITHDRAFT_108822 [Guillardia theta CCMP2712]
MGRTSVASLKQRMNKEQCPVIVTWNVVEYRKAAQKHVEQTDVVLEVGCCGGTTTSIIGKQCDFTMGIDQTQAEIDIARKRFGQPGHVEFEVMDAFDMPAVLRMQEKVGRKFNKVFIDINGSRDIGPVCDCLDKYQKVLRPELIVLKSIKLKNLLYQCVPWDEEHSEQTEEAAEETKPSEGAD